MSDRVGFIMAFEQGDATPNQIVDGFAEMIAGGSVWSLQGFYGRTAQSLIADGYISRDGAVLHYPEGTKS